MEEPDLAGDRIPGISDFRQEVFIMWTRTMLKQRAKTILNRSYWRSVLAGLLLSLSVGGMSRVTAILHNANPSNTQHYDFNINGMEQQFDYYGGRFLPHIRFSGFHLPQFFSYGNMPPEAALNATIGFLPVILGLLGVAIFSSSLLGIALRFFVLAPLEVGSQRYFIVNRVMTGETPVDEMIYPFNHSYINVVKGIFLRELYTFLWSMLFVIPGIIKHYSYRLVPYILAESPDMDTEEAFRLSMEMMDGNKWDAFILDLSFLGWEILSALTMGILGLFYVHPYRACTNAELYATLRDEYLG